MGRPGRHPSSSFFFWPSPHARPKCESQGVGSPCYKEATVSSRQSCIWFSSSLRSAHASSQIPNPGFCFTQYRGRDNCSLFILTPHCFQGNRALGDRGQASGRPASARPGVNPLLSNYTCCYGNDSITGSNANAKLCATRVSLV